MIWVDRIAVGALALAAMVFAGVYGTDQSRKDAMIAHLEYSAEVGFCDISKMVGRHLEEPCPRPERIVSVRTLGSTGVEFLIFGFSPILAVWLVLRLIDAESGGPERRRRRALPAD